jgi:hypothetical protein
MRSELTFQRVTLCAPAGELNFETREVLRCPSGFVDGPASGCKRVFLQAGRAWGRPVVFEHRLGPAQVSLSVGKHSSVVAHRFEVQTEAVDCAATNAGFVKASVSNRSLGCCCSRSVALILRFASRHQRTGDRDLEPERPADRNGLTSDSAAHRQSPSPVEGFLVCNSPFAVAV